jgi:hypothetical protein
MKFPCLRMDKEFVAVPENETGDLIVKLTPARADALIEEDVGIGFSPSSRKPFKGWIRVAKREKQLWNSLIQEGADARLSKK